MPCHYAADADSDADAILLPPRPPIRYYGVTFADTLRVMPLSERARRQPAILPMRAMSRHTLLPPPPLMPRAPPPC
jgi:hypothetical protein